MKNYNKEEEEREIFVCYISPLIGFDGYPGY